MDKLSANIDRVAAVLRDGGTAGTSAGMRWLADAAAMRFHLRNSKDLPLVTVVLGGTGTGKSTLVNRLIGSEISAASFRRTFTSGAVAIVDAADRLPSGWLGVEHVAAGTEALPVRGQSDKLLVVELGTLSQSSQMRGISLIDTPDLDGDQPAHHTQADRAFRWAQRIIFVVTPEKYQMTEMLPYYRLARRYQVPALFVMNKCEEPAVLDDFRRQLADRDWADAPVFVIPRDDAAFEAPAEMNLPALRLALQQASAEQLPVSKGLNNRSIDLASRLGDQIIAPQREARRHVDQLSAALKAMETPAAGVDVNPITLQLQRRLQQRSVLYLIGPQRMLDRVRQMPTLLARLPRATWDWLMRGQVPADLIDPKSKVNPTDPPDFQALLTDQFTVVRSRIDDVLRGDPLALQWLTDETSGYSTALIDPTAAGTIATEEIAGLKQWLETRWNATPRDTRILQALLKYLPGGRKLTQWTEAAPYLLTLIVVMHHAFFGHIDLMVLGGYSLATWLTERISNEVSSRTRAANRRISERFEELVHQQIQQMIGWLGRRACSRAQLDQLDMLAGELAGAVGES